MRSLVCIFLTAVLALANPYGPMLTASVGSTGTNPGTPDLLWIKANEGTGTVAGDMSSGYTGTNQWTLANSGMWTTGKAGNGLQGNGTTYSASWPSQTGWGSIITVCFWLKDSSYTSTEILLEISTDFNVSNHSWSIYDDTGGVSGAVHGTAGYRVAQNSAAADGTFHHYAIILDNSTVTGDVQIYRDGTSSYTTTTSTKSGSGNFGSGFAGFAFARNSSSFRSNGTMDDIRIYNRALTSSEITYVSNAANAQ